ncbi:MAG: DUF4345 domain-containing protein [Myxococcota bacterium]|jgi:hypothetical protein|nr:hypothetical protein [Deltaproteobacteria bacterium]MCP4241654.1 DUF4345 domain-containing protein [bacterium]MDP6075439.1 DUF4345 domain-containing protein [Myxococcota bacterium]MDP6243701.1 DUF4345 domain-containing protein [Myxococcota bacterium]MDP7075653.1 DUF4345 domain-containing protein [Myxococcota bacterium]
MSQVALILNGLIMTMIGIRGLVAPGAFLGDYGVELTSVTAIAEARSIHGGAFAALAILMWLGLLRSSFRITALRAAAFVMLGLAFGRLVGVAVDGATDSATLVATIGETVLGGLALIALVRGDGTSSTRA